MAICKEDLIGQIEHLPINIVETMLYYQVEQGNTSNVKVFQDISDASRNREGFNWHQTQEGTAFWAEIINKGNYENFYKRYPEGTHPKLVGEDNIKGDTLPEIGEEIIVWNIKSKHRAIFLGYIYNATKPVAVAYGDAIKDYNEGKKVNLTLFTYYELIPKPQIVELTLEDISKGKGKGVPVELLRIVDAK